MGFQDPFNDPAFNMANLTDAINLVPVQYGRIGQLGLFRESGITTRTVVVERNNGILTILPFVERGGTPTLGATAKRDVRSFIVPHIPLDDVVMPEEIQGIREFGSEDSMRATATMINEKLQQAARNHDITLEHLRAGAIRGLVLDADGTEMLNFFDAFGETEQAFDFDLGTDNDSVKSQALQVLNHMEDNLRGDTMSGVMALCSPGFWEKLIVVPEVKVAYDRWQEGAYLRQDPRVAFPYAGIMWEQYRGKATDMAGTWQDFIPAGDARFFPTGTQSTFRLYYAPADMNDTVNTIGLRRYARQQPRQFERGWDIHTQSNPLPVVLRPSVLARGFSST